jgi:hypothetical protein
MDDISSGEISCRCGWSGAIGDIPLNFKISNFLICPKCGTEDLIFASRILKKKLKNRIALYNAHINDSIIFSKSKIVDFTNSKRKVSLFVGIVNKIYYFNTCYKLTGLGNSFVCLKGEASTIKYAAVQFIEDQHLKTTYRLESTVNDIWGKKNFATNLAYYSEIAEQIEKDVDQNESFEICSWG